MSDVILPEIEVGGPDLGDAPTPLLVLLKGKKVRASDAPDISACEHGQYSLDPEWQIVRCSKCGERIDAFVVLKKQAEYWEALQRDYSNVKRRWCAVLGYEISAMAERVGVPTALRDEARAATLWGAAARQEPSQLWQLHLRLTRAIATHRSERRRTRRAHA